jgi:hypothetical protein
VNGCGLVSIRLSPRLPFCDMSTVYENYEPVCGVRHVISLSALRFIRSIVVRMCFVTRPIESCCYVTKVVWRGCSA